MTYRCDNCGAIFYEPEKRHHRENLDGENGVEEYDYSTCPNCGSADIRQEDEADD